MNTPSHSSELLPTSNSELAPLTIEQTKILVAVDYLTGDPQVFERALKLAKAERGCLMIFHCLQRQIQGTPDFLSYAGIGMYSGVYSQQILELEEQLVREATEELQSWLSSLVQRAKAEGVEVVSDYQVGDPGKKICKTAKEWGANLIAIGRRGRRGLSELLLGSVSNYVVHHAHCSVLVVQ